jgi:hypothetical protein
MQHGVVWVDDKLWMDKCAVEAFTGLMLVVTGAVELESGGILGGVGVGVGKNVPTPTSV